MRLLILIFALTSGSLLAQKSSAPTAYIRVVAKYQADKKTVLLRFLADKRSVLGVGLKNGFTIERAEIKSKISRASDIKYHKIATATTYSTQEWNQALRKADEPLAKRLKMAQSFYKHLTNTQGTGKDDLANLFKQKKSEDFELAMLVLATTQNAKIAQALGLGYQDKTVRKGKKYVYRVTIKNYSGPYQIETIPFIITTKKQNNAKKRKINIVEGDTQLNFSWEENDLISGVLVERKDTPSGSFKPLNEVPKYSLSENSLRNGFQDTALVNYQTYEYRFYGIDAFGEKILFAQATATPRDRTPPKTPLMESATQVNPGTVRIRWQVPTPIDGDLKGFNVKRSQSDKGPFKSLNTKLLSKATRLYSDDKFEPSGTNYYVVEAIDTAGNTSTSFAGYATIVDTIAPTQPKILSAKMDSSGVVTIIITKNKEADLMGYRLYWANNPKHEFSVCKEGFREWNDGKEVKLVFRDSVTLHTLTPNIYYQVKALDYHYNQSAFSTTKKVKRIDVITPTTPVFHNVSVEKDAIELTFALSQSTDVKAHYLYRKTNDQAPWEKIAKLKPNQKTYTDKKLKKGQQYIYSIRAMDDSNLYSDYALPAYGKPYDTGIRPAVKQFSAKKDGHQFVLTWSYPKSKIETYFIIYKSNKSGQLVQYRRTDQTTLTERGQKGTQKFAIRAFTKDGGQSEMSNVIEITL